VPIHDWTRVHPRLFNNFRLIWITRISETLNRRLPSEYYSLIQPSPESPTTERKPDSDFAISSFVVVCRESDDSVAAVVAVVPAIEPGEQPASLLALPRIGRVVIQAHPAAIMAATAYEPGEALRVISTLLSVGDPLPDVPLFIESDRHIAVPLETTYRDAWDVFPARWREVIEGSEPKESGDADRA
jgi:hypothetical protein